MSRAERVEAEFVLTEAERAQLLRWSHGESARLAVTAGTVTRWRGRFVAHRLDGLVDEPRPGRPPSILLDQVEDVVIATLEQTPPNAPHWSRTSMAPVAGPRNVSTVSAEPPPSRAAARTWTRPATNRIDSTVDGSISDRSANQ